MSRNDETKEERRFTLRLSSTESKALEELKTVVKENSDSAVMRFIIMNYKKQWLELQKCNQNYSELEQEKRDLENKIDVFLTAWENLRPK